MYSLQLSALPKEIGQLTNLFQLTLHDNKLIRLPQSFSNLKQLKVLSLSVGVESEISLDTLPIAQLTSLKTLYLRTYVYI